MCFLFILSLLDCSGGFADHGPLRQEPCGGELSPRAALAPLGAQDHVGRGAERRKGKQRWKSQAKVGSETMKSH